MDEILQEYDKLVQEESQGETEETPKEDVENFSYFLGDKQNQIPSNAEFVFKHAGQDQRVPISKLINASRQASHLQKQLEERSKALEAYNNYPKPQDLETKQQELQKFIQLQKWSEENPDDFNNIWSLYEQRRNGVNVNDESQALNATISQLRDEISGLKEWKSSYEQEVEEQKTQKDMKQIEEDAQSFAKEWDLDLDEADENGLTLKSRILKFGIDNEMPNFKAAGLTYLEGKLRDKLLAKGRSEAIQGVKSDKQAGILGRTGTPSTGQSVDVRTMSDEQRTEAALAEYAKLVENNA